MKCFINYTPDTICSNFPLNSQSNTQICSTLNCAVPVIVDEYFKSVLNHCTPYRPNELIRVVHVWTTNVLPPLLPSP